MIIRRYINGKKVDVEVKTSEPIYPEQSNVKPDPNAPPPTNTPPPSAKPYVPPTTAKRKGCGCGRK
jgi:hypothetical protein